MNILTLSNAIWETIHVDCGQTLLDINNVYYKKLSGRYQGKILLIDSFLNLVDIVPENAVIVLENHLYTYIVNRYNTYHNNRNYQLESIYNTNAQTEFNKKKIAVFTICPTYSCNMACVYCFERHYNTTSEIISKENLLIILEHIKAEIKSIRNEDPQYPIRIEFFGGEPLQMETYDIVKTVLDFAKKENCEIGIVTNGYLLFEYTSLLVQYRDRIVEIMVTLDGPKEIHNFMRRSKKMHDDAFQKIVTGIDLYLSLGIPVNISTNIDKNNAKHIKYLFEFYHQMKWDENPYFFVVIGRVYDRTAKELSNNLMSEIDIYKIFYEMFPDGKGPRWMRFGFLKTTERIARDFHIAYKQNEYGKIPYHYCWATSPTISGYYVDPELDTFRCTTTVGLKKYSLGNIKNVNHNSFIKNNIWGKSNVFSNIECLNCKIGGFCGGGCVLEREARGERICQDEQNTFNRFINEIIIPKIYDEATLN